MKAYEFIVKMKDHASSGLQRIARSAGVSTRRIGQTDTAMKKASRTTGVWSGKLSRLKTGLVAAFSVAVISMFGSKVIQARAEYERFDAVLTNTFQSAEKGEAAMGMLQQFAAETPFQLNKLTDSYVKLVNRGFVPSQGQMTKLGDLASSQGKSFLQLSEAILDAQTNEFERLKEFGIRGSKAGDQVSLSFKGVTKTVQNNGEAIRAAILEFGAMDGVAGSMAAISKTLGGRISNLKDQWWNFLVVAGGQSGGLLSGGIDILSKGLAFLTGILPEVGLWFESLWNSIQPVIMAIWHFVDALFLGFGSSGNVLETFGSIMKGVLVFVNLFMTGLSFLIEILAPFAPIIGAITAAWALWNYQVAIFNFLANLNPVGFIIAGIVALIAVIGMVTKYTSGWGEAWQHTVNGAKLLWKAFVDFNKLAFLNFINQIMIGINKIKTGWYKFKEALGMGDSTENQAMLEQIRKDTEQRKNAIRDAAKDVKNTWEAAKNEFSQVQINVDTQGLKKDWQGIKDKFASLGGGTGTNPMGLLNKDEDQTQEGDPDKTLSKTPGQTIVSGGPKSTNIHVTIQKLQDDTKIFVNSTEKGLSQLGEKVQEVLLRSVNSVNQMA